LSCPTLLKSNSPESRIVLPEVEARKSLPTGCPPAGEHVPV
jgi:hypothetical protein